ncbi:hypothetical protein Vadar_011519 [Vaccinium darrowii]|uniref:Uncharacterized protein n=1 Tax=Vaccinium darrowii TaxID=229202 RepID=A0ACB7Y668_9ERIC|nr:hypothetical protein Vadar_011519 [Vaccinium darrowii]
MIAFLLLNAQGFCSADKLHHSPWHGVVAFIPNELIPNEMLMTEAYNRALVAEKQEKRKFSRFGLQFHPSQGGSKSGQPYYSCSRGGSSFSGGQVASSGVGNQTRADKATTFTQNQPQSNGLGTRGQFQSRGFKCFKCGKPGLKSSDCRRSSGSKNKALFMEESCEDEFPIYDEALCEDIGGDDEEEVGLALMIKKTLLTPNDYSNKDWLHTNIFYSTCNIGGREKATTKPPPTTLLASKGFLKESHESGYVLVLVPMADMGVSDVPEAVSRLLKDKKRGSSRDSGYNFIHLKAVPSRDSPTTPILGVDLPLVVAKLLLPGLVIKPGRIKLQLPLKISLNPVVWELEVNSKVEDSSVLSVGNRVTSLWIVGGLPEVKTRHFLWRKVVKMSFLFMTKLCVRILEVMMKRK